MKEIKEMRGKIEPMRLPKEAMPHEVNAPLMQGNVHDNNEHFTNQLSGAGSIEARSRDIWKGMPFHSSDNHDIFRALATPVHLGEGWGCTKQVFGVFAEDQAQHIQ